MQAECYVTSCVECHIYWAYPGEAVKVCENCGQDTKEIDSLPVGTSVTFPSYFQPKDNQNVSTENS